MAVKCNVWYCCARTDQVRLHFPDRISRDPWSHTLLCWSRASRRHKARALPHRASHTLARACRKVLKSQLCSHSVEEIESRADFWEIRVPWHRVHTPLQELVIFFSKISSSVVFVLPGATVPQNWQFWRRLAQHTAHTRQHSAIHCISLQLVAVCCIRCNTLQHIYTYTDIRVFHLASLRLKINIFGVGLRNVPLILGSTLQHTATLWKTHTPLSKTHLCCNTLQRIYLHTHKHFLPCATAPQNRQFWRRLPQRAAHTRLHSRIAP